jgi:hypothetical protein
MIVVVVGLVIVVVGLVVTVVAAIVGLVVVVVAVVMVTAVVVVSVVKLVPGTFSNFRHMRFKGPTLDGAYVFASSDIRTTAILVRWVGIRYMKLRHFVIRTHKHRRARGLSITKTLEN